MQQAEFGTEPIKKSFEFIISSFRPNITPTSSPRLRIGGNNSTRALKARPKFSVSCKNFRVCQQAGSDRTHLALSMGLQDLNLSLTWMRKYSRDKVVRDLGIDPVRFESNKPRSGYRPDKVLSAIDPSPTHLDNAILSDLGHTQVCS